MVNVDDKVLDFISDNASLINNNKFDELYDKYEQILGLCGSADQLTKILVDCDIDVLPYISKCISRMFRKVDVSKMYKTFKLPENVKEVNMSSFDETIFNDIIITKNILDALPYYKEIFLTAKINNLIIDKEVVDLKSTIAANNVANIVIPKESKLESMHIEWLRKYKGDLFIPKNVKDLGKHVAVLPGVKSVTIDPENKYFKIADDGSIISIEDNEIKGITSKTVLSKDTAQDFNLTLDQDNVLYMPDMVRQVIDWPSNLKDVKKIVFSKNSNCAQVLWGMKNSDYPNLKELVFENNKLKKLPSLEVSSLETLTFGTSVEVLLFENFTGCARLTTINYLGTKKQWDELVKRSPNFEYENIQRIKCTDGDILISSADIKIFDNSVAENITLITQPTKYFIIAHKFNPTTFCSFTDFSVKQKAFNAEVFDLAKKNKFKYPVIFVNKASAEKYLDTYLASMRKSLDIVSYDNYVFKERSELRGIYQRVPLVNFSDNVYVSTLRFDKMTNDGRNKIIKTIPDYFINSKYTIK